MSETPALAGQTLEQLVARAGTLPAAVRNNAGGHWNRSFFWQTMAPPAHAGEMAPGLKSAMEASFGSLCSGDIASLTIPDTIPKEGNT